MCKVGMPNLGEKVWIATLEIYKATLAIEASGDGVPIGICSAAGSTVPVGATIATLRLLDEQAFATTQPPQEVAIDATPTKVQTATAVPPHARIRASPAARALAEEQGFDLTDLRATREDEIISRHDRKAASAQLALPAAVPLSSMRRAIVAASTGSWQSAPHLALPVPADLTQVPKDGKFGVTAAIVRPEALVLRAHPQLHGWFLDGSFHAARHAKIAVADVTAEGVATGTLPKVAIKAKSTICCRARWHTRQAAA